eukprot:CAMPEP_0172501262 /NCGR_PEP_ID=MMETSP1066-20121228/147794_1 /TAXON_ID=671091 /ORGANISM="Coscinodiscus wailesii, Strain CCMP2513" /LENGTH=57 /DNA_ID=CAMNT_0013275935 /DNA_START=1 /DNA_END=170 /DNA_ORIENTATION=+
MKMTWDERFQELAQYVSWSGSCHVPVTCETNPELGVWLEAQKESVRLFQEEKPCSLT